MLKVAKELRFLKDKSNEVNNKLANDERIIALQRDIKWFKTEALSLNKIVDKQKNKLEQQKNVSNEMGQNVSFLHKNAKEQMKQNKLLQTACDKQRDMNAALKDFFANNSATDWQKKRTDHDYVLTSVGSGHDYDTEVRSEPDLQAFPEGIVTRENKRKSQLAD